MERLLKNDRIRTLLREADDALRLIDRHDGAEALEYREALSGILRDLGLAVHGEWRSLQGHERAGGGSRTDPLADEDDFEFRPRDENSEEKTAESLEVDPNTDIPEQTSDAVGATGEDLERWYTDEVEIERNQPLFNPGELDEALDTEAVDRALAPPGLSGAEDDVPVIVMDGFEVPAYGAEPWVDGLRDLVAMLGAPPPDPTGDPEADSASLAEEVSKVQWAASSLETRWEGFPPAVRTALLGVLASRARHLQERLDVDLGPRMALDRLRKHRRAASLPSAAGLVTDRGPETGSWAEDARWWWRALTVGLDAGPSSS